MNEPWKVVIASNDVEERRALANILAKLRLDPVFVPTIHECEEIMAHENVGLIFCARSLADGRFRDLLKASRNNTPRTRIVPMICLTNWDEYLEAMRLGAFDIISVPCHPTDVEWMIIQALRDENARSKQRMLAQQNASPYGDARASESA